MSEQKTLPKSYKLPAIAYHEGRYDPLATFENLTRYTCPMGFEVALYGELLEAIGCTQDPIGNFMIKIGESKTMFASHMDTAGKEQTPLRINHEWDYDSKAQRLKVNSGGESVLGADDRAGMTIMLGMILNNIPGLYYFFMGEESGRIGSEWAMEKMAFTDYERVICWDRRGYSDFITHQMGQRGCSDEFARALIEQYENLGIMYVMDDTGTYTDSYSFYQDIPECTNLSVGYENAHTKWEWQDVEFLQEVYEASLLIDWEGLPTKQNPHDREDVYSRAYWKADYGYGYDTGATTRTVGDDEWADFREPPEGADYPSDKQIKKLAQKIGGDWYYHPDNPKGYHAMTPALRTIEGKIRSGVASYEEILELVWADPDGAAIMIMRAMGGQSLVD